MDYEKLHKETITKLQEMVNSGKITVETACGICADFVPESEDERIRKDMIETIKKEAKDFPSSVIAEKSNIWIAWLEKQGETFTKKDVDDAYLKGVTDTKNEIEKQYEANYQIRKDIATFIFNYKGDIKDRAKWIDYLDIKVSFAEMQGEQKTLCDKCKKAQPSHFCQDITALGRCAVEHEQKPAEWSEEDKAIIDYLLQLINNSHKEPCTKGLIAFGAEAWLKSLKDRVQPQPKQEWSEE